MTFPGLLAQLAAEHAALQDRYEQAMAEAATLRSQLQSLEQAGVSGKAASHPFRPLMEPSLVEKECCHHRATAKQFLHNSHHLMLAPVPTRSSTRSATLGLSQREFRPKPCFNISDEDLRFLRPRVYDLDIAMHDFELRQREMKRHAAFRNLMQKKKMAESERRASCIMNPQSDVRLCWDSMSLVAICYDVVMTPLALIMNDESGWVRVLGHTINAFWTLDIFMNLRTGFVAETELVMDWKSIAKTYLSKWFLFDVMVILPDWVAILNKNGEDAFSAVRSLKVVRMMRLMRLVKMKRIVGDIFCRVKSDAAIMLVRLLIFIAGIVACLHFTACFWYLVGDTEDGWVAALDVKHSVRDGYLIALHWAVTAVQGSLWSTTPLTLWERLYVILIFPIALTMTAVFIACTIQLMQQSTNFTTDLARQRSALRTIAMHYQFPLDLTLRVKRFIEADRSIRRLREREDQLLGEVSPDLRRDLKMQIYMNMLGRHAFLKFLASRNPYFVRQLCSVLQTHDFLAGEIIFNPGEAATMARFIAKGHFQYVHGNDIQEDSIVSLGLSTMNTCSLKNFALLKAPTSKLQLQDHAEHSVILGHGQCVSEPVLWTLFEHCGELTALSQGTCASLESKTFEEAVMLYPMVLWLSVLYSRQFIIHINKNFMTDLVEPPDIQKWEPEAVEATADEGAELPFEGDLPPHCKSEVVKACMQLSQDVAAHGLDENRPHHGFTVIIGDGKALATCGKSGFNPFEGNNVRVVNEGGTTSTEAIEILRRNAFHTDGAVVVDGRSGQVVASSWFVGDIQLGGMEGGARSRSARAVAQQAGGCYVIKCSEDSRGKLILHLNEKTRVFTSSVTSTKR